MAANNGDTLVEAVISAKRTNSDYDNEKNSNSKKQPENCLNIIINQIFQQCLKDEN
jgi:hypothetical protein